MRFPRGSAVERFKARMLGEIERRMQEMFGLSAFVTAPPASADGVSISTYVAAATAQRPPASAGGIQFQPTSPPPRPRDHRLQPVVFNFNLRRRRHGA